MIILPTEHLWHSAYIQPAKVVEVALKVDPTTTVGLFQAGYLGILRYGQNWVQCGWIRFAGMPWEFCELWRNSAIAAFQTFAPLSPDSTLNVAAVYTTDGQWVMWMQAQGQPWSVVNVSDITLSTGQYLTPQNAYYWVATEGEGTIAPPLVFSSVLP